MHTVEGDSAIKQEWNKAICSNMDASRDYHTKWRKPDRERQIPYDIIYMRNLKHDTNAFIYAMNKITNTENRRVVVKGRRLWRDGVGGWG